MKCIKKIYITREEQKLLKDFSIMITENEELKEMDIEDIYELIENIASDYKWFQDFVIEYED